MNAIIGLGFSWAYSDVHEFHYRSFKKPKKEKKKEIRKRPIVAFMDATTGLRSHKSLYWYS